MVEKLLLFLIIISSCTYKCNEILDKGNLIFQAENNDLIGVDQLDLYDNNVFHFVTTDYEGGGKYSISNDTIFLYYQECQSYKIKGFVIGVEFICPIGGMDDYCIYVLENSL